MQCSINWEQHSWHNWKSSTVSGQSILEGSPLLESFVVLTWSPGGYLTIPSFLGSVLFTVCMARITIISFIIFHICPASCITTDCILRTCGFTRTVDFTSIAYRFRRFPGLCSIAVFFKLWGIPFKSIWMHLCSSKSLKSLSWSRIK